jgi:hypothetical protein
MHYVLPRRRLYKPYASTAMSALLAHFAVTVAPIPIHIAEARGSVKGRICCILLHLPPLPHTPWPSAIYPPTLKDSSSLVNRSLRTPPLL